MFGFVELSEPTPAAPMLAVPISTCPAKGHIVIESLCERGNRTLILQLSSVGTDVAVECSSVYKNVSWTEVTALVKLDLDKLSYFTHTRIHTQTHTHLVA